MTALPRAEEGVLMAPDVAHIGYHRTGTNFLQAEVFPAMARDLHVPDGSGWELFKLPTGAPLDLAAAEAFYGPRRAAAGEGRLLVMTHESLSGTITDDNLETPARLARLNPAMRVLVVLRSQYSIFPSLYHLHVKGTGPLRYPDYLREALAGGKCDYLAMVERLHEAFGPERVWVGLYEDLQADAQGFVDGLSAFLGLASPRLAPRAEAVNRSPSLAVINARRLGNALMGGSGAESEQRLTGWRHWLRERAAAVAHKSDAALRTIGANGPASLETAETRALIAEQRGAGNRRLADLIRKPLDELGYPL